MSTENHYVALPTLMGAPAGRRRPSEDGQLHRPFDPDDLPLERSRSQEDRQLAAELFPPIYPSPYPVTAAQRSASLEVAAASAPSRPMFLRGIAGRLMGRNQS